jgi:phosphatidylserine/phosphatidylglycerophosphate/cardiolipin synthase-like enzyme
VEGPAVADIERTFVERWNDSSRTRNWPFEATDPDQPVITEPIGTYAPTGSHSVQVLRTYGVGQYSYSWADAPGKGEFSIWASTLNAIKKAETYIYIEDQTFLTFGWPASCDDIFNPARMAKDLIYQLGEALERGVRVGVIISNKDSIPFEIFQRNYSLNFLNSIASNHNSNFFVGYLHNGSDVIYVHSKMFIVDDEFALIGSANFDQRSMTHDGELKIGIIDENNQFVKTLRSELYHEHSQQPAASVDDPVIAFDSMKSYVASGTGRLRNYDFSNLSEPYGHSEAVNNIWWPYAGP